MSKERVDAPVVVFICDRCGKKALAGSDDLLQNWTKGGSIEGWPPNDVHTRWNLCGSCS